MSELTDRLERINDKLVDLAEGTKPELGDGGSYEMSDTLWDLAHDVAYCRGMSQAIDKQCTRDLEPMTRSRSDTPIILLWSAQV